MNYRAVLSACEMRALFASKGVFSRLMCFRVPLLLTRKLGAFSFIGLCFFSLSSWLQNIQS